MADVELVIRIPEEIIEYVRNNNCLAVSYCDELAEAIANGTPLPKGHGRLIDENDVLRYCALYQVPTIIEADKEGAKE